MWVCENERFFKKPIVCFCLRCKEFVTPVNILHNKKDCETQGVSPCFNLVGQRLVDSLAMFSSLRAQIKYILYMCILCLNYQMYLSGRSYTGAPY